MLTVLTAESRRDKNGRKRVVKEMLTGSLSHFSRRHRPLSQVVRVLISLLISSHYVYYLRAWHRLWSNAQLTTLNGDRRKKNCLLQQYKWKRIKIRLTRLIINVPYGSIRDHSWLFHQSLTKTGRSREVILEVGDVRKWPFVMFV